MTYDVLHQATFTFGGFDEHSQGLEDTWIFASQSKTTLTITVPAGIQYAISGFPFTGTQTISLPQGMYSLTMASPQSTGTGSQAVFVSWSDGGTLSHQLNLTTPTLNVIGTFKTQYLLTTSANPADEGIVTQSGSGFYDAGTIASVVALGNPGFAFTGWSGACSGSNPLCILTMNAPASVTGSFARAMFQVTINTPPGVSYSLGGFPFTGSVSIPLPAGSYSLSVNSPVSTGAGSRSVFVSWSDGGAETHNIVVTTAPITVTGTFKTQYQLTTALNPINEGSVTQAAGPFYDAGSVAVAVAVPKPGYEFEYWSGGCTGSSGICLVTMNAPQSVVANFSLPLDWVQLFPANHPSARFSSAMAYDIANKQAVLFGGNDNITLDDLGDTWIWDGVNWTQKFPAHHPSPRDSVLMTYDAARQRVVLFGGGDRNFNEFAETWLWDGTDWSLSSAVGPPSNGGTNSIAYDAAHQQVVVYGGLTGGLSNPTLQFGTWVWNGTIWTKIGADTPQIQEGGAMAYDAVRQRVVMNSNGTWTWDGAQWTTASGSIAPGVGVGQPIVYDLLHQQTLGVGEEATSTITSIWDGANWIQRFPAQSLPPFTPQAMVYDTNAQNVVFFDQENVETWVWIAPVVSLVPQATTVANDGAGNYLVTVTLRNQGNIPVSLLFATTATLGGVANTGFTTPQFIGPINPGATGSFTAKFPIAAFPTSPKPTPAVSFTGSYSAGPVSGAAWSVNVRSVTLP